MSPNEITLTCTWEMKTTSISAYYITQIPLIWSIDSTHIHGSRCRVVAHGSARRRGIDTDIGQRSQRFSWAGRKLKRSSVQYKNYSWYIIHLKMVKSIEFKCIYHKNTFCVHIKCATCLDSVIWLLPQPVEGLNYPAGKKIKSFIVKLSLVQVNAFLGTLLGLIFMWGIVTPQREMVMFNAEVTSEMSTGMYLFQGINIA